MNKERALPLAILGSPGLVQSLGVVRYMEGQRDADWERIKPLVAAANRAWSKAKIEYDSAALETFSEEITDPNENWAEFEALKAALAPFEEE